MPYFVASSGQAHWKVVPDYWKGGVEENFRRWLTHEQWVLDAKQVYPGLVHSLRYEDIISNQHGNHAAFFSHFGLDMPEEVRVKTRDMIRSPGSKNLPPESVPDIEGFPEMMHRYGYSPDGSVYEKPDLPF